MRSPAEILARLASAALFGLLLAGCASDVDRIAARAERLSADPSAEADYRKLVAAALAREGLMRLGTAPDPAVVPAPAAGTTGRLQALVAAAPAASAPAAGAASRRGDLTTPWRTARQALYLAPPNGNSGDAPYTFSGVQADRIEIDLVPVRDTLYRLDFACDGALEVRSPAGLRRYPAGRRIQLAGSGGDGRGERGEGWPATTLSPSAELTRCDGRAHFPAGTRPLRIRREEAGQKALARLDGEYQRCTLPRPSPDDDLANAFYAVGPLSETCPFRLGPSALLPTEREGFDAKVKALLGTPLPARFYETGNPELPLDFSHAPRLSLIYLSYLEIKADFSGRVIDRLLRFHAARGTPIRILSSKVLERDKDRRMLEQLAGDHPNVQFRAFAWQAPPGRGLGERLARFHRVNHVKLLAALSPDPARSVAILGGRNIHDGFLFGAPLDLSSFPALQQYGAARGLTLNYYSNWRDLDIAIHDDRTARLLAAHLSTLWDEDALTRIARPFSVAARGREPPREGFARHFLSVPYTDGRALERSYVGLLDAARSRIDIVNPYFNLTAPIRAALDRALDRGVKVTVVGRITIEGDLGGRLLTAINEDFVLQYYRRAAIYNYRDPTFLLHAKVLMIDHRLAVVSGVNLNNRSFIHDTENGLVVLDRAFCRRLADVVAQYRAGADRVTRAPEQSNLRLLLRMRTIREAL